MFSDSQINVLPLFFFVVFNLPLCLQVFEGVYNNARLLHFLTAVVVSTAPTLV